MAEAARKAKAQQKNEPKPGKVFTDDDVANLKGEISVVGSEPAPASRTPQRQRRKAAKPAKARSWHR